MVLSPEMHVFSESAQAFGPAEGTTNHGESSMHEQAEKASSANDPGKSDDLIVLLKRESQSGGSKPGNSGAGKAVRPSRDSGDTPPTLSGGHSVFERLDRITKRAETHPEGVFNNLFSLLTYELLWNLQDLTARLHRGAYHPQPSLRRDIPKGSGKTRPLGIACVEDKIVPRAVVTILEGSVLSPLLANVYLHYVLDEWFERDVRPRLRGEAYLIRYADDFICRAIQTEPAGSRAGFRAAMQRSADLSGDFHRSRSVPLSIDLAHVRQSTSKDNCISIGFVLAVLWKGVFEFRHGCSSWGG